MIAEVSFPFSNSTITKKKIIIIKKIREKASQTNFAL